jgi:hypothetical protein
MGKQVTRLSEDFAGSSKLVASPEAQADLSYLCRIEKGARQGSLSFLPSLLKYICCMLFFIPGLMDQSCDALGLNTWAEVSHICPSTSHCHRFTFRLGCQIELNVFLKPAV